MKHFLPSPCYLISFTEVLRNSFCKQNPSGQVFWFRLTLFAFTLLTQWHYPCYSHLYIPSLSAKSTSPWPLPNPSPILPFQIVSSVFVFCILICLSGSNPINRVLAFSKASYFPKFFLQTPNSSPCNPSFLTLKRMKHATTLFPLQSYSSISIDWFRGSISSPWKQGTFQSA